jgi:hypothetical protein
VKSLKTPVGGFLSVGIEANVPGFTDRGRACCTAAAFVGLVRRAVPGGQLCRAAAARRAYVGYP